VTPHRSVAAAFAAAAVALAALAPSPAGALEGGPAPASAPAAVPPLVTEATLHAPVEAAWAILTTAEGWKAFGVAHAEVDLRVGGLVRTHYSPSGRLGDPSTIENTILAYEPHRMFAFRATKAPAGFPFPAEILDRMWTVAELRDLGDGRSRLTLRGHGWTTDPASVRMRAFFERGNEASVRLLTSRHPRPPSAGDPALDPIEATGLVPASPSAAFAAWTSAEGWKRAMGVEARVALEAGGPFEIEFAASAPAGSRGSEGCVVQAWLPGRLLAFSWNAPPTLPRMRAARTRVVVEFETEGPGTTRLRVHHDGFRDLAAGDPSLAAEAREARAYFAAAWPKVLEAFARAK
jgi:uncharacterized protein YndB with AHSA1/START domain